MDTRSVAVLVVNIGIVRVGVRQWRMTVLVRIGFATVPGERVRMLVRSLSLGLTRPL